MGKLATKYLIRVIILYITIIIAIITITGRCAGIIDPTKSYIIAIIGLVMSPLIVLNLALLIYWIISRRAWFIVPLIAIITNIGFITATFQISFKSKDAPYDIKIATYNVHAFKTEGLRITAEKIAEFLKEENVDLVCFQEFHTDTKYSIDSLRRTYSFMPYTFIPENGGQTGSIVVLSKFPITASHLTSFKDTDNSALWVDVDVKGRIIRIFNNHLQTTSINQSRQEIAQINSDMIIDQDTKALDLVASRLGSNFKKRAEQVHQIRAAMDATQGPMIVCGDFNDTPASYAYHTLMKGMKDGFKSAGNGYQYTYKGLKKTLRIDYIIHSKDLEGVRYYSPYIELSDHNPVLMELSFRN